MVCARRKTGSRSRRTLSTRQTISEAPSSHQDLIESDLGVLLLILVEAGRREVEEWEGTRVDGVGGVPGERRGVGAGELGGGRREGDDWRSGRRWVRDHGKRAVLMPLDAAMERCRRRVGNARDVVGWAERGLKLDEIRPT